jgi:hypothetical protein
MVAPGPTATFRIVSIVCSLLSVNVESALFWLIFRADSSPLEPA